VPQTEGPERLRDDVPLAIVEQARTAMAPREARPWWTHLPGVIGLAAGQQTIQQKLQQLGPQDPRRWQAARDAYQAYPLRNTDLLRQEMALLDNPGDLTHSQLTDRLHDLRKQRQGAWEQLRYDFPHAILDPKAREEFRQRLPGLPVEDLRARLPQLPPEQVQALATEVERPPNVPEGNLFALQQERNRVLARWSRQTGLAESTLKQLVFVHRAGRELPALGVPDLAVET
jgi:hypothetical protein